MMLIACARCHNQYDVGDLPPGSTVRCDCGETIAVEEQRTHQAPVQRCSACGGALSDGARSCEFCGADITLGERGWGDACPECYARLVAGAKFCSACGTEIRPMSVRTSETGETCPRCESTLATVEIPGGSFVECTSCGGVWLGEDAFEGAVEKGEENSAVAGYFSRARPGEAREREEAIARGRRDVRYLPCPVCGQLMNRENFARSSGVVIDRCPGHGYWFDPHELERILAFVSSGGLENAMRRELERKKYEAEMASVRSSRTPTPAYSHQEPGLRITLGGRTPSGGGLLGALMAFLVGHPGDRDG